MATVEQTSTAVEHDQDGPDPSWFVHDRFGLFIHWGIGSLPVPWEHGWFMHFERTSTETYQKYFDHFDPDLYDPAFWAREAKNAGMKYFVATTKHHDGFCLWDTTLSEYKATNTPAGRDLIRPMVDAFREEGLKVGFYHSLIDWHHPEFTIDNLHPLRDDEAFRESQKHRDISKYAEYLHGQTRELLTQFGDVDLMWFDFSYPDLEIFPEVGLPVYDWASGKGANEWQSEKLLRLVRELQPSILVNDRLAIPADYWTPESYQPPRWFEVNGKRVIYEVCQPLNGYYTYSRDNHAWKSVEMLVQMLVDIVSKGGNLLLNVGPTGRGEFEPKTLERLRGIGEWMRLHGRSIYGCSESEFTTPPDCRYTLNGNRLYLHVFTWPAGHLHLEGLAERVEYAQLLNDGSEITMQVVGERQARGSLLQGMSPGTLTLNLPVPKPNVAVPVIELFLKDR
jgi:alpha-L-fucosidase